MAIPTPAVVRLSGWRTSRNKSSGWQRSLASKGNDVKPIRFNVLNETGEVRAVVRGTLSDVADHPEQAVLTLAHPYPDFDVEAGAELMGGVFLVATGPRVGQRIPCTRG